jgi:hypothetical protein
LDSSSGYVSRWRHRVREEFRLEVVDSEES